MIISATACDCIGSTFEDAENTYVRKFGKSGQPKDRDFKSNHERGKEINQAVLPCDTICGHFGVSIDIWNTDSKKDIIRRYRKTLTFAPKSKDKLAVFRVLDGKGKIAYTPVQNPERNVHHHDLYKCDHFSVEDSIDIVEVLPIKDLPNV